MHFFFVQAQEDSVQRRTKFNYSLELGTYSGIRDNIPFWLRANMFGAVPRDINSVYLRQQIESKTDTSNRFFDVNYCIDFMAVMGNRAQIILPEAFLDLRFKWLHLSGGRFKNIHGLVDSTLSSGSITWAGNTLGIPEVRISIPQYKKFIFKWLAFKGHYSHGWFGEQQKVRNSFFHQKSFYGRLGTSTSRLNLYGGILHNAQWGGIPKYQLPPGDDRFTNGRFPNDAFTYYQVVLPLKARQDSSGTYGLFEETNRFGSHIGQVDLGGTLKIKNSQLMVYKQTIFETGATFSSLTNVDDGLYGISLGNLGQKTAFRKLVLEFLHTMNQGAYRSGLARLLGLPDRQFGNSTFYFNHMQYQDGWSYQGNTIGTPFMLPQEFIRVQKQSTVQGETFINNNRLKAFYAASAWQINGIDISSRVSFSRNYGSQFERLPPAKQVSFLLSLQFPFKKTNASLGIRLGIDQGDLIRDNYGAHIYYKRVW